MKMLRWGLNPELGATTVYGARTIFRKGYGFEVVRDRQHCVDDDDDKSRMKALVTKFNSVWDQLQEEARKLDPRVGKRVTLYEDDEIKVVADTKGSCGYLYIAAWFHTRDT